MYNKDWKESFSFQAKEEKGKKKKLKRKPKVTWKRAILHIILVNKIESNTKN